MFKRLTVLIIIYLFTSALYADNVMDESNVVHKSSEDFEYTFENINDAILARGMVISNTVHLSDMLSRTGKDLGFETSIYKHAESIEFCNALISHKLSVADPRNLINCPFSISVYETEKKPGIVYVTYRRYKVIEESSAISSAIHKMLEEIVQEAIE